MTGFKQTATVVLLAGLGFTGTSQANIINIDFNGQITNQFFNGSIPIGLNFGDIFTSGFSYDNESNGYILSQTVGSVKIYDALPSFWVDINGSRFESIGARAELAHGYPYSDTISFHSGLAIGLKNMME